MPKRFAICPARAEWSEEMVISNLNTRVIKILLISLITILISPATVSFWLLPPVCAPQVTVVIKLEVASTAEAFTKTLAIIEFSGLAEEVL